MREDGERHGRITIWEEERDWEEGKGRRKVIGENMFRLIVHN